MTVSKIATKVDDILFRCSSLGHIMIEANGITEKQLGKIEELKAKPKLTDLQKEELARLLFKKNSPPELSDTTKRHLVDVYTSQFYGRREKTKNKFLEKGNAREEDSITLVSRLLRALFIKNTVRLTNEFIQGEPDIFLGKSIDKAETTLDTKSSWSVHTFLRAKQEDVKDIYYWQGQGYMWLTGAKKHLVVYCLVNGTDKAIEREKKMAYYDLEIIDEASENYLLYKDECKQIEINHIFDLDSFKKEYPFFQFDNDISEWKHDIPMRDRMFAFEIERNEADIERIKKRVKECRKYIYDNLLTEAQKNLPLLSNNN